MNTSFLLGRPSFRCELLVSGSVFLKMFNRLIWMIWVVILLNLFGEFSGQGWDVRSQTYFGQSFWVAFKDYFYLLWKI